MKLKFSQLAKAVLCTAAMAVSALGSMTISASAADNCCSPRKIRKTQKCGITRN